MEIFAAITKEDRTGVTPEEARAATEALGFTICHQDDEIHWLIEVPWWNEAIGDCELNTMPADEVITISWEVG